jgi:hypothetical protein
MDTNTLILINKFGQDLLSFHDIESTFKNYSITEKKSFLVGLSNLIIQTKAKENDIDAAIKLGQLKNSFTPCVKIRKGINTNVLESIIDLPETETSKVLRLFLSLYKIAYQRIIAREQDNPYKWWFQDLSDNEFVDRIQSLTNVKLIIKKLYDLKGRETGAILSTIIPFSMTLFEKNIIEQRLKLYAFNNLYPQEGLNLFNSIYEDTASLTVIRNLNDLNAEEKEISMY